MNGGGFPASAFAQAFGGRGGGGIHVHEINPEEIFNMFFNGQGMHGFRAGGGRNGGFREQQRYEREDSRGRRHQQQQPREPPSLFMQF